MGSALRARRFLFEWKQPEPDSEREAAMSKNWSMRNWKVAAVVSLVCGVMNLLQHFQFQRDAPTSLWEGAQIVVAPIVVFVVFALVVSRVTRSAEIKESNRS